MRRVLRLFSCLAAVVCLSGSASTQAGPLDCGCSRTPMHHAPMMYTAPEMGVGGGVAHPGSLYESAGFYDVGYAGGYGHSYGGGYYGSPDPRSFESGFENLPNMDGGGVHHRLPFHSYRRPWAHPGIADNNINISW